MQISYIVCTLGGMLTILELLGAEEFFLLIVKLCVMSCGPLQTCAQKNTLWPPRKQEEELVLCVSVSVCETGK